MTLVTLGKEVAAHYEAKIAKFLECADVSFRKVACKAMATFGKEATAPCAAEIVKLIEIRHPHGRRSRQFHQSCESPQPH